MINISKNLASTIIERIESNMFQSWWNADTMRTEKEYYDDYHKLDTYIVEQLKKEIEND